MVIDPTPSPKENKKPGTLTKSTNLAKISQQILPKNFYASSQNTFFLGIVHPTSIMLNEKTDDGGMVIIQFPVL